MFVSYRTDHGLSRSPVVQLDHLRPRLAANTLKVPNNRCAWEPTRLSSDVGGDADSLGTGFRG